MTDRPSIDAEKERLQEGLLVIGGAVLGLLAIAQLRATSEADVNKCQDCGLEGPLSKRLHGCAERASLRNQVQTESAEARKRAGGDGMTAQVLALFISEKGPYATDPRFDAWGKTRDARKCRAKKPAVCHPRCERYGRMARGSPSNQRFEIGDDGGDFVFCRDHVRAHGGIIEHPAGSHAYEMHGLPVPPRKGWSPPDEWGGRSCRIDQGAYGHPAKKATWLYAVLPVYPELNWTRVSTGVYIGGDGYHGKKERDRARASSKGIQKAPQVPAEWNWRTPDALKEVLYQMAATAVGWTPVRRQTQQPLAILEERAP